VLKNDALRGAAAGRQTLFCMSTASQDDEKRACIHDALHQGGAPAPFAEVAALSDLDDDQLSNWRGLFVGMPYGQRFAPRLIARLVTWVRGGGRLALCGFEMGERHHETNLNQLGYHFGVAFNSDIVVRPPRDQEAEAAYVAEMTYRKGYGDPLRYDRFTSGAPLLDQVQSLAIANACSLHLEPGARPIVFATPNRVKELTFESGRYSAPPHFKLAYGDQVFDAPYADGRRAVAAIAPADLTLGGSVLALGSWDFRGRTLAHDNARFLRNVSDWLGDPRRSPA